MLNVDILMKDETLIKIKMVARIDEVARVTPVVFAAMMTECSLKELEW